MSVYQSKSKRHNYAEFGSGLNSVLTAINQRVFPRTTEIYFKIFTLLLMKISKFSIDYLPNNCDKSTSVKEIQILLYCKGELLKSNKDLTMQSLS